MSWPIEPSKHWDKPRDNLLLEKIRAAQKDHGYFNSEDYMAIAALASHYVTDPEMLRDVKIPSDKEWLAKIAPLLADSSEDIFDQANTFVIAYRQNGNKLMQATQQCANPEDLKKMMQEAQKELQRKKSGGTKGGPPSMDFESGDWYRWLAHVKRQNMPSLGKSKVKTRAQTTRSTVFEEGEPPVKFRRTVMQRPSDIRYLTTEALAMEDDQFFQAYLEKKLPIDLPVRTVKNKQTIMVLVDRSGSMGTFTKMIALVHILNELLEEVLAGNTRLMFAYFTHDREEFIPIETQKEVEYFKSHVFADPCGGSTYIGEILKKISDNIIATGRVDTHKVDARTEILVINDGEDDVTVLPIKMPVTAFMLEQKNADLATLTRSTGGEAYYVNGRNFLLL